jgi:hypothetical protein
MEVQIAGWRLAKAWNRHEDNVGPRAKVCLEKMNMFSTSIEGSILFLGGHSVRIDDGS